MFSRILHVIESFYFVFPTTLMIPDEDEHFKNLMTFPLIKWWHFSWFYKAIIFYKGFFNTKIQTTRDLNLFIIKNNLYIKNCDILTAWIIYILLPVTVATAERSFSKLQLINNYLGNSMSQDRLSNIVILNIERGLTNRLDLEKMILSFAEIKTRKVNWWWTVKKTTCYNIPIPVIKNHKKNIYNYNLFATTRNK